eukprot:TRINITY_DN17556_c0_g1_i1.p1 TRINITY_DN17556_c0_g1~~TRINITY_DN17556_c0_g1_i1.p1  ORF type:complete len:906 (-),score=197.54 TRINITY_DN17556_c0_g1_i1:503-3220(-)
MVFPCVLARQSLPQQATLTAAVVAAPCRRQSSPMATTSLAVGLSRDCPGNGGAALERRGGVSPTRACAKVAILPEERDGHRLSNLQGGGGGGRRHFLSTQLPSSRSTGALPVCDEVASEQKGKRHFPAEATQPAGRTLSRRGMHHSVSQQVLPQAAASQVGLCLSARSRSASAGRPTQRVGSPSRSVSPRQRLEDIAGGPLLRSSSGLASFGGSGLRLRQPQSWALERSPSEKHLQAEAMAPHRRSDGVAQSLSRMGSGVATNQRHSLSPGRQRHLDSAGAKGALQLLDMAFIADASTLETASAEQRSGSRSRAQRHPATSPSRLRSPSRSEGGHLKARCTMSSPALAEVLPGALASSSPAEASITPSRRTSGGSKARQSPHAPARQLQGEAGRPSSPGPQRSSERARFASEMTLTLGTSPHGQLRSARTPQPQRGWASSIVEAGSFQALSPRSMRSVGRAVADENNKARVSGALSSAVEESHSVLSSVPSLPGGLASPGAAPQHAYRPLLQAILDGGPARGRGGAHAQPHAPRHSQVKVQQLTPPQCQLPLAALTYGPLVPSQQLRQATPPRLEHPAASARVFAAAFSQPSAGPASCIELLTATPVELPASAEAGTTAASSPLQGLGEAPSADITVRSSDFTFENIGACYAKVDVGCGTGFETPPVEAVAVAVAGEAAAASARVAAIAPASTFDHTYTSFTARVKAAAAALQHAGLLTQADEEEVVLDSPMGAPQPLQRRRSVTEVGRSRVAHTVANWPPQKMAFDGEAAGASSSSAGRKKPEKPAALSTPRPLVPPQLPGKPAAEVLAEACNPSAPSEEAARGERAAKGESEPATVATAEEAPAKKTDAEEPAAAAFAVHVSEPSAGTLLRRLLFALLVVVALCSPASRTGWMTKMRWVVRSM